MVQELGIKSVTEKLDGVDLRLRVHVYDMSQICPYDFKNQYSGFLHVQVTE